MKLVALVALSALSLVVACQGRPRPGSLAQSDAGGGSPFSFSTAKVIELDLSGGAPEGTGDGLFPQPASRTFTGLIRSIERASRDQDAKALFVRFGTGSLGFSRSEEVARAFAAVSAQGKPVVCHAHSLDNAGAMLALKGCDRLWLSPAGDISTVGIAGQTLYFKGALEKLEVRTDFVHVGKYKSAVESLTQDAPSDEARESLLHVLTSIRKTWLDTSASGKRKPKELQKSLELGPWSGKEAKERGLVDELGFERDALDDAKKLANTKRVSTLFGTRSEQSSGPDLAELIRVIVGSGETTQGPRVSVVVAEGSITMEPGGLLGGGGITAKSMQKILRRLADDDAVKAVVLRIDSPGGSALASDLIWHELRELEKKKPIVVSVGSMAASGGYYLACAGTKIYAERTSIVGSIGVFGGKISLGDTLERYGVTSATFHTSDSPEARARSTYLSGITPWDEATMKRVHKNMVDTYDLFLRRVVDGRDMPLEKAKESAEGRIWTGTQGHARGLVDELGGLTEAIEHARTLGELDERSPVVVEGGKESLLDMLLLGEGASEAEITRAVLHAQANRSTLLQGVSETWRPFLSTLEPLLHGERNLTALPFAFRVQ